MTAWRLLVVEDDQHIAEDLRVRLTALGYEVIGVAAKAADALRIAYTERPDLVLMDVLLPGGMDGVEAAGLLRGEAIPVVYLTAHSDDALLERVKCTEPFGYLVKPYTERELHATVTLAVYRHHVQQVLAHASAELQQARVELERKVEERTKHLAELNDRLLQEVAERRQMEEALRESGHHLRQIVDLVPDMIFAKDVDGRFLLANRASAMSYGMTPADLVGRCQRELHSDPQQLENMLADDRKVIDSGEPRVNYEETFTTSDGACRVLRTTKIPYRIKGGEQRAVLGIAVDITEMKQNESRLIASEQKYRAILENAVDAIFLCAGDGRILDANRRASQLLGYSKEELLAMNAAELHPVEEHERLREVFEELLAGQTTLVVHPVVRKDGAVIYCEVAATPLRFGEQFLTQGIFRDVTERERLAAERSLREQQHRDTLVREVHHRIKNNLQGVVGLLRDHASAHPELLEPIGSAIGQVQSIAVVHGLLGQGVDGEVLLCDLVRSIARNASMVTRAAVEPAVDLAVERPVKIDKDEAVAVALILNELILNAVKHGGGNSVAPVTVKVMQDDSGAEVVVCNRGTLPQDLDFGAGRPSGAGTGLGLVHSLLPHSGATLRLEQVSGGVRACLRLGIPVVSC